MEVISEVVMTKPYTKENANELSSFLNGGFFEQDEQVHQLMRTAMAEGIEEQNNVLLFDTITKRKIPYKKFVELYSENAANTYLKYARRKTRVPEEVSKRFWSKYANKKKEHTKKNKATIPDQFVPIRFPIISDEELWKKMSKYMGIYIYLFRNIVRGEMVYDKLNIYERYYKKGKLAYATSYRKLGKMNNSKNSAERYVKELVKIGAIEIEQVDITVKDKRGRSVKATESVFILGTHNMKEKPDNVETYYINTIL